MGYYTGFRFIGLLKPKYEKDITSIFGTKECDENCWVKFAKKYPFAKKFSEDSRCEFIPFGYNDLPRILGAFDHHNEFIVDGIDIYEDGVTWNFACSLKDYDNTIELFLQSIASEICEKFIAYSWGESSLFPVVYQKNI